MGTSGVSYAGRARFLLENIGRKGDLRASREELEDFLISVLNASGEKALNEIRDSAAALANALSADKQFEQLRGIIGALLGTHATGELKTKAGKAVAKGAPVDAERMTRFETLATHLRSEPVPHINNTVVGQARQNFAFIESYFSNFVEGTKFDIEQARDIVINQTIVANRPKDSHDILGVYRLAITSPYRDSPPVAGSRRWPRGRPPNRRHQPSRAGCP